MRRHRRRAAHRATEPSARELAPQPGVHDVGGLVDQIRETGLAVQLWVEGEPRALSPGVDLAAFRLVQEALTNTLKHAGPQARAWVRLQYADRAAHRRDRGRRPRCRGGARRHGDGLGHGLVGMRERVALYGGELRIGPRPRRRLRGPRPIPAGDPVNSESSDHDRVLLVDDQPLLRTGFRLILGGRDRHRGGR